MRFSTYSIVFPGFTALTACAAETDPADDGSSQGSTASGGSSIGTGGDVNQTGGNANASTGGNGTQTGGNGNTGTGGGGLGQDGTNNAFDAWDMDESLCGFTHVTGWSIVLNGTTYDETPSILSAVSAIDATPASVKVLTSKGDITLEFDSEISVGMTGAVTGTLTSKQDVGSFPSPTFCFQGAIERGAFTSETEPNVVFDRLVAEDVGIDSGSGCEYTPEYKISTCFPETLL
ncbi:MAG: hypothetical protein MK135_14515 [Polyangiaceae bacterium]|nr:hypothetical protein [Polyangiaceae bacterium]